MIAKIFKRLFLIVAIVYLALCAWLYVEQRSLLYFPTPAARGIQAQAFELQSDDVLLKGWVVNPGQKRALIYFGGNAEAVENNAEDFKNVLPNVSVYLLPYRSYGGNPGDATEENLYRDSLSLYDKIRTRHDHVYVMGRSLGTGIATYLASKRRIDKLILVTPYDSMVNVAQGHYPAFPAGLIIKDRYESWRRASGIDSAVFVMVAGMDEVIPRSNTENLLRHFKTKPTVVLFQKSDHNSISDDEKYGRTLALFMDAKYADQGH